MHTVRKMEPNLWTVGTFVKDGWLAVDDFESFGTAMAYCSWLNGGLSPELERRIMDAFKIGGIFDRRP